MGVLEYAGKFILAAVITAVGLFWSAVVALNVIVMCFRKGFRNVFHWEDRRKSQQPLHYHAWDNDTRQSPGPSTKRWNHAYVTVPETGMRFHYVYSGKVPGNIAISDVDGETVMLSNEDEKGDARPKLMICVHGYPENWFSWRHVLRYFDNADADIGDYFVVAMDMRGYGDSEIPKNFKEYHMNNLVCDIKGVANALGYEQIILVGHDWGGVITWEVAEIYPELTEKIIVMNAPHNRAFQEAVKKKPGQILKSWYMLFFQVPYLPDICNRLSDFKAVESAFNGKRGGILNSENRLTKEEVEVFKYSLRHSTTAPINYYRALIWPFAQPGPPLLYPRTGPREGSLKRVPALLIWGDQDAYLTKEIAENTKKCINAANGSRVVIVKGASHWVQQDAPEDVIQHMVEFLKQ